MIAEAADTVTTTRAQSRDQTVRATFHPAQGVHVRLKPGSLAQHSPKSLATALRETIAVALRELDSPADPEPPEELSVSGDPDRIRTLWRELRAIRSSAVGSAEGIRVTWAQGTVTVAVRGFVTRWEETEAAREAAEAVNAMLAAHGDQAMRLIDAALNPGGDA